MFEKIRLWIEWLWNLLGSFIPITIGGKIYSFISHPLVWKSWVAGSLIATVLFIILARRSRRGRRVRSLPQPTTTPASTTTSPPTPPGTSGAQPPTQRPNPGQQSLLSSRIKQFLNSAWTRELMLLMFGVYGTAIFITWVLPRPLGVVNLPAILLTIFLLHFRSGFRVVSEREVGVKIVAGLMSEQLESGPTFAPRPVRLETVTTIAIQTVAGTVDETETEETRLSEVSPSFFRMKDRMGINWTSIENTPDATPEEKERFGNHLYGKELTTDVKFYYELEVHSLPHLIKEAGTKQVKCLSDEQYNNWIY